MKSNKKRETTNYSLNFLEQHLPTESGRRLYAEEACKMAVATSLVRAMQEQGRNQADVAKILDCTAGFVSQVLSGSRNMTLNTLADFAFGLGLEVADVSLVPLGEALVPKEKVDQWLDEESLVAKGSVEMVGTATHESIEIEAYDITASSAGGALVA